MSSNPDTTQFEHVDYLFSYYMSQSICYALSFIYPAYASFKAIRTEGGSDDKQWLMYWVIFGILHVLEFWLISIFYYLPFYWEIKCLLIIWLQHPRTRGATVLYEKYVQPFLKKNESKIDSELANLKVYAVKGLKAGVDRLSKSISPETKQDLLTKGISAAVSASQEKKE